MKFLTKAAATSVGAFNVPLGTATSSLAVGTRAGVQLAAVCQELLVPPFQNVHVYALLADLLGLTPARTDGSLDSVRTLLR